MKIRISDPDIPGNEAMRSDLDLVLGHDKRAVEQREVANRAAPIFADRKGATGVTGDVVANHNRARSHVAQKTKNLRAFAIKSIAELNAGWNRLRPPVALDMSI